MHFRRMKSEDRPHLRELVESTNVFLPSEVDCALEIAHEVIEKTDDYEAIVAADENDLPIGFAIYGPTPMSETTWDLYWIATHARAKGKGVGTAVMTEMEADVRSRKGRMIRIETSGRDAYGPTRGFYEKTKYHPVGCFPNFYKAGDDLVILAKDLGQAEVRPSVARLPS